MRTTAQRGIRNEKREMGNAEKESNVNKPIAKDFCLQSARKIANHTCPQVPRIDILLVTSDVFFVMLISHGVPFFI